MDKLLLQITSARVKIAHTIKPECEHAKLDKFLSLQHTNFKYVQHFLPKYSNERQILQYLPKILQSPFLDASVDEARQVSSLAVLHDNVQRGVSPVYDAVIVPHYVWVLEFPQQVHL